MKPSAAGASAGAGPSRRSHTKSRKGCKTCKRRHIRCDENYPQCRNCTKHQVQCDYMESVGSDSDSQLSPEQPAIILTPGTESRFDLWQRTGNFPYPDLQVFPAPRAQEYSNNELRLIHHLSSVSNELLLKGTTNLTMWTQKVPKFLSIASSYPYVMHALLSFSANHLAFTHSSQETRSIYLQHGSIALRGLHEAIGNFSRANADAVLAASLLLLWQATDWRSWSSLRAGVQSVLSAMSSWKHESIFAEFIEEEDLLATAFRAHRRTSSVSSMDRASILQNTSFELQRLQAALVGHEFELNSIGQLLAYVQQLQTLNSSQTPEEQFNCLYLLRKWLFWLPVSFLTRDGGEGPAVMTVAHFYATAITLEPLFPDLGSSFCSAMALPPLEAIIDMTDAMRSRHTTDASSSEIESLMQFPKQTALNYRSRALRLHQSTVLQQGSMFTVDPDTLSYTSIGNLSPAFAPSTPQYAMAPAASSATPSYLEVPNSQSSFTYGMQAWGAMPSPGFPPQTYAVQQDPMSYSSLSSSGFRGGFVPPPPIWT